MKASDRIVRFLERQGVEYVFGYQGGMITHLVDSLSKSKRVRFVPCYHEQSAAFAAEGYARATGRIGVCLTTSGPGATNTLTSVGNAYFDSVPVLYITGQVNAYEYKYDKKIRQQGFQETDIVSIARPIAKAVKLADDPTRLMLDLRQLVEIAISGRKGPVLLDLPMNVQRADIADGDDAPVKELPLTENLSADGAKEIASVFSSANRPLVLCGGGLAKREVREAARAFLRESGYPYVVSLMGKGLVDETNVNCLGMIGSYGNRCANMALARADVVLTLGSRLDLRQTGNRKSELLKNIKFIRIDVDSSELEENRLPNQLAFKGDCATFLSSAYARQLKCSQTLWCDFAQSLKARFSQENDVERFVEKTLPYDIMNRIGSLATERDDFVVDIGQNQMWAAQMLRPNGCQMFLTSGGMAPMGYAVPAAVGMAFANPNRHVYCLCGDGGLHIAVQSLLLISQYRLPVTVVVFNNQALGMITQFQRLYFDSNMAGTTKDGGYCVPSFSDLAAAYGLRYSCVTETGGFPRCCRGGELIEVKLDGLTAVVPKLEFSKDLDDMTPSIVE